MIQQAPHLGIYPKEMKVYIHINTYAWIFIVVLFISAPNLKQHLGEFKKKKN